ncbi:hypothetical protein BC2230_40863 [Burkholderia cepacia]
MNGRKRQFSLLMQTQFVLDSACPPNAQHADEESLPDQHLRPFDSWLVRGRQLEERRPSSPAS